MQAGAEGAEKYQGRDGLRQLEHVLRDVKAAQLLELKWQLGQCEALLRVDRLSADFGRPEDLEAAASTRQPPPAAAPLGAEGGGPVATPAQGAAQLRHFAPVRLLGGSWGLISSELMLTCMPRMPEDKMLSELEAMCRELGTTGAPLLAVSSMCFIGVCACLAAGLAPEGDVPPHEPQRAPPPQMCRHAVLHGPLSSCVHCTAVLTLRAPLTA